MAHVMFVITTETNMGDIALCQEWIHDLGRDSHTFAFVLSETLASYIDETDRSYFYAHDLPVKQTILDSMALFQPDVMIFASNSFWNLPGYQGVEFGRFVLEESDVDFPVLSFDPFEIGFDYQLPLSGHVVSFPSVPDWVYALRYMSRVPASPNALHFCTRKIFQESLGLDRDEILRKWRGDPDKKSIFFAISKDRYEYARNNYPEYYDHLRRMFSLLPAQDVQIFCIAPEEITEFCELGNVIQLRFVKFYDFLSLIRASDIYLTDSFISCVVNAFHMGIPALLLANSAKNSELSDGSFLQGKFFPYKIFPYGMVDICEELEKKFEIHDCYRQAEVLEPDKFSAIVHALLYDTVTGKQLVDACSRWKTLRLELPAPRDVLRQILPRELSSSA